MSAKTLDRAGLSLVQRIVAANKSGDAATALQLSELGATMHPEFVLPGVLPGGFASLVTQFRALAPSAPAPAPKAAARPAPVAEPAPAPVETLTLRLVHDGVAPTSIFGVEKDSEAHKVIGAKRNGGLGWQWWGPTGAFYLRNSKGFAADTAKISQAVDALESLRDAATGTQLYRVAQQIATTGADGAPLPVYETKAERAARMQAWQIQYTGRMNTAEWQRGIGAAECATCQRTGLDVRTSRITKDDAKLPRVQCVGCLGEPEPEAASVDMSALALALDSKPAPMPESEVCGSCRQLVEVKGGRFVLHTKPFSATACRGKVGVAPVKDVEPEPAAAPKPAVRKARPAAAPVKAAPSVVVDTQDLQAELSAALIAGDNEAAARVFAAMQERATAAREAAERAAESAAKRTEAAAELGASWRFATVDGISGTTLKNSATSARQDMIRALVKAGFKVARQGVSGVKVEVRRDRDAKVLVATVTELPEESVSAAKLAKVVRSVVSSQRGVLAATKI